MQRTCREQHDLRLQERAISEAHASDAARLERCSDEVGDRIAGQYLEVGMRAHSRQERAFGIRFEPSHRGKTIEAAGFERMLENCAAEPKGQGLHLPLRRTTLETFEERHQVRFNFKSTYAEQALRRVVVRLQVLIVE